MKLTEIDTVAGSDEGAVLQLHHPGTDEALEGTWIKLAGPDSKIAKQRRMALRRALRKKGTANLDLDMLEEEAKATRVAVTLAWDGIELDDGPVTCTPENAGMIYDRFPWIAEQVDVFQGDRANFIATHSKQRKRG